MRSEYWLAIWLASVLPGSKRLSVIGNAVADHLGDGDRLAERPAEPEDDRRDDAAPTEGTTTPCTISQRVAPSPSAASFKLARARSRRARGRSTR